MNIDNNISKGFVRNFSVLTISNVLVNILGLFINVYLARTLKPALYGEYGVIITTANIFYIISSLGLQQIVIRSVARNQNNSKFYFQISLIARFVGFIFSIIVFVIYSIYVDKQYSLLIYFLMVLYIFSMSGWDAFQNIAFGMQRMEFTGYINIIASIVMLVAYLLLPVKYLSLANVFIIISIVLILKLILYYYSLQKYKFITGNSCDSIELKTNVIQLMKDSLPYFIMSVFTLFTTQMPVLFLDYNSNTHEVAFFNTANKLLVPVTLLISTAMSALFPELSKLYIENKKLFQKRVEISYQFLIFLGVYCAIIVSLYRNEVVSVLYGDEYSTTGLIMAYQSWYVVMYSIFWFFGSVFGAVDKQNLLARLSIIYAVISVPILWYCSKFGAESVSKGYIIISIINMTYNYYFFQKSLPEKFSIMETIKDFGLISIAFAGCLIVPDDISIFIKIALTILVSVFMFVKLRGKYLKSKAI